MALFFQLDFTSGFPPLYMLSMIGHESQRRQHQLLNILGPGRPSRAGRFDASLFAPNSLHMYLGGISTLQNQHTRFIRVPLSRLTPPM